VENDANDGENDEANPRMHDGIKSAGSLEESPALESIFSFAREFEQTLSLSKCGGGCGGGASPAARSRPRGGGGVRV